MTDERHPEDRGWDEARAEAVEYASRTIAYQREVEVARLSALNERLERVRDGLCATVEDLIDAIEHSGEFGPTLRDRRVSEAREAIAAARQEANGG